MEAPGPLLSSLPLPASRRVAIRATPAAVRRLRQGHPWLFADAVTDTSHPGAPGDLGVVFDRDRRFVAVGLWDPDSPIALRVLHANEPATIDRAWFDAAIDTAIAARRPLLDDPTTTAYRLVHGENDRLPGLVVDRYGDSLVVKLYSAAWFAHLVPVVDVLATQCAPSRIVVRMARQVARHGAPIADGSVVIGDEPRAPEPFLEHGLAFTADLVRGQKTGHFLDQRDNRVRVGGLAADRRVLDVFGCTGGFSVHAAAGGAAEVCTVDLSRHALAAATRHMAANGGRAAVARCRHTTRRGDAFEVLADLARRGERHELVVIDPPAFATSRATVPAAEAAYRRLTRLGLAVLAPGGVLVQASCSSRVTGDDFAHLVLDEADRVGEPLAVIERTGHPLDHPIGFLGGAYLDAVFARRR